MRESGRSAYFAQEDLHCDFDNRVSRVRVSYDDTTDIDGAALRALTRRLSGRGFARAAGQYQELAESMEEEARSISPAHYRWDEICADGRGDQFRHEECGERKVMGVNDFAAYFATCRTRRPIAEETKSVSLIEAEAVLPARTKEESRCFGNNKSMASEQRRQVRAERTDRLVSVAKEWLQPDDPTQRRHGQRRALPMSLISVLVVIAVSLMLIVSGSVMVASAKREVSDLGDEVAKLEREAALLTDRLEAELDYLEIYRVATEHYGMIPASYVDSLYVDSLPENTVETFDGEGETVGLSTLLSAIGINLGTKD